MPLTVSSSLRKSSMDTCWAISMTLACLPSAYGSSWIRGIESAPYQQSGYHFRAYDKLPIQKEEQCECPPHKECRENYQINEDMATFQNIRAINCLLFDYSSAELIQTHTIDKGNCVDKPPVFILPVFIKILRYPKFDNKNSEVTEEYKYS
ncbi:hypothetical protein K1T71_000183 [Dendrolimus kikuchii]|uniref:Uncharacterized protein n=1 Tax=Dendrolimus kikuchii TaxID=765133 RepID=A0ACC1DIZ0_9NEOP|nr:hypothetical protein K1T71_000183 [Dendrolimus kikuchii]